MDGKLAARNGQIERLFDDHLPRVVTQLVQPSRLCCMIIALGAVRGSMLPPTVRSPVVSLLHG